MRAFITCFSVQCSSSDSLREQWLENTSNVESVQHGGSMGKHRHWKPAAQFHVRRFNDNDGYILFSLFSSASWNFPISWSNAVSLCVCLFVYTVSQKTVQNCFCQNFVIFPPILIIFGRQMAKRLKLCEMHLISTSTNSRHHTTV